MIEKQRGRGGRREERRRRRRRRKCDSNEIRRDAPYDGQKGGTRR